jgi:integrase
VLALDEETKLLEALHLRFQRFVRFALGTGCRLDEIRGIDPARDIDSAARSTSSASSARSATCRCSPTRRAR